MSRGINLRIFLRRMKSWTFLSPTTGVINRDSDTSKCERSMSPMPANFRPGFLVGRRNTLFGGGTPFEISTVIFRIKIGDQRRFMPGVSS
jgi:hypothetical protein